MTRAAEKLRRQGSIAGMVGVWLETNRFRQQDPQYHPSVSARLPQATDDTLRLVGFATALMRRIFRTGYRYVKAGVMLLDLRARSIVQGSLFDASQEFDERRTRLMAVLDRASTKWGRGVLAPGSAGMTARWAMRREHMTPAYTTRWEELVRVAC
jgi:DNA polymerase V